MVGSHLRCRWRWRIAENGRSRVRFGLHILVRRLDGVDFGVVEPIGRARPDRLEVDQIGSRYPTSVANAKANKNKACSDAEP